MQYSLDTRGTVPLPPGFGGATLLLRHRCASSRTALAMKLYNEPIWLNSAARPPVFVWRGQQYRVLRLVDWWVVQGRWWTAEEKRRVYLVQARSPVDEGFYEIAHSSNRDWLLIRVYD